MSRSSKGRGGRSRPRLAWLHRLRLAAVVHPRRCAALAAGMVGLAALIATTSLPMALAESNPRLALWLYPDHPKALLTLARQERARMTFATARAEQEAAAEAEQAAAAAARENAERDTAAGPAVEVEPEEDPVARQAREHTASLAAPRSETAEEAEPAEAAETPGAQPGAADMVAMRARLRDFATRIAAGAPLEASAYRLLGDTADDLDTSRQAMLDAVARSRRETVAVFWLMHQDFERKDYAGVVALAEVLLQTRPALNQYTMSYLNSLALEPEGRAALVAALARNPSWRPLFLSSMGSKLAASDAPLALIQALKAAGSPPSQAELIPLLRARMVAEKRAEGAYNIWLQMLPAEEVLKVQPVNNLDFAADPSTLPFNWNIPRSMNAFIDLQPRSDTVDGRVLRIRFGVGRVRLGGVEQVTFLRPGTYRFSGEQKGVMSSKRGMVWQVLCYPGGPVAGQSGQLMGAPRVWRPFSFDITIPDNGRCDAQRLRLFHDSRSTSEQFASGEIQFQSLHIAPVEPVASGG
ncbi:hypothetical protein [Ancylobacter sp. IITR112]|uniref:hypothetical protein n=1 Tax=Ancylobacter sp. IITR112 TaxID=3138073 RepID=UPI00352A4C72